MKKSKNEMIRVAMIAILCCMVCSCKTQHNATKVLTVDEAARSIMTETETGMSMEDMKRLMREKEDWYIVWYSEPDTDGKHVIAAEAWISKEKESQEDKKNTEVKAEQRNEENEQHRHEKEEEETEMKLKTGMEWWQTMAMSAGAMMVVLMGWMVKRVVDGRKRKS